MLLPVTVSPLLMIALIFSCFGAGFLVGRSWPK
jgi:hypothetical protein